MKRKSWRADEMEMSINFRAMRAAYIFSVIALLIYCGYELAVRQALPTIPFIILCIQGTIFFSVKLGISKKYSGD